MKKNLLAISMLVASTIGYAQDTYIGDKAVVKVQPNTLFCHGSNVTIAPSSQTGDPLTEIVKNQGFIEIAKDYKNSISDSKGAEFVNMYTAESDYGQVIIKGSNAATTGKLTMEKRSVSSAAIQQFPMAFPFQGDADQVMYSFEGKAPNNFRGNCGLDVRCGQRYWMTLFYWDNNKIVNDAVQNKSQLVPGGYYLLNIIQNTGLNTEYNGTNIVNYKGQPAPSSVSFTNLKTQAVGVDGFEASTYNSWKGKLNKYGETYWSYLGHGTDNIEYGKNIFRFGNPYTSNINISDPSSWMNLSNLPFQVTKLSTSFSHTWNSTTGSSHNSTPDTQFIKATYVNGTWTGQGEAILVRPLEMFQIDFTQSSLVTLNVNLTNAHKTFNQTPSLSVVATPNARTAESFHQLKVTLVDSDNNIASEPVYLAASTKFETGNNINPIYSSSLSLIEEDVDGNTIANAKSHINTFNDDYVAKPLRLEINGLPEGNSYKMKFNLKENNIFTEDVNKFSNNAKFYLHDKIKDTYTEINGNSEINITISDKSLDQYSFFWKETPKMLNTADLDKKFTTKVYKFTSKDYRVKLDTSKKSANIEIYSITGEKIGIQNNINITNSNDIKLNIPNDHSGLFIIKVVYDDGTNSNLKVLVD